MGGGSHDGTEWWRTFSKEALHHEASIVALRPELRHFAFLMEEKLRANDHKGGWEDLSLQSLWGLLYQELEELLYAIDSNLLDNIVEEAVDIANFCMMMSSLVQRRIQEGQ